MSWRGKWASIAAALMAIAVILGALGAHALENKISIDQLASFQTGVRYHLVHGLALLLLALAPVGDLKWRKRALWLMIFGVVFFSVSIYLLSTRDLFGIVNWSKIIGPITPIGGLCFILAWVFTFLDLRKLKSV